MLILAIETSCDDTAIAVLEARGVKRVSFNILASIVSSQTEIHAPYGGVVPNLAARAHQRNLPIILEGVYNKFLKSQITNPKSQTNSKSKFSNKIQNSSPTADLSRAAKFKIDLIAVTTGPGLEPSLWAGVNFAKSLSMISNIPIIGVNHIEGHIASNWLKPIRGISNFQFLISKQIVSNFPISKFIFPALCLIVSGGHTQLILMKNYGKYRLLGETRDDAAGEAFDKVAKLLGLGYPGGPAIAAKAAQIPNHKSQITNKSNPPTGGLNPKLSFQYGQIKLPRPMINSSDYDFSFSGLKTAVLYKLRELQKSKMFHVSCSRFQERICAEFQQAVIDVLIYKTLRAAKEFKVKTILCGGGVMANRALRQQLKEAVHNELPQISLFIPPVWLCTDNAAMIGAAGYYKYLRQGADKLAKVKANGNQFF